ncbi:MAG: FliA/WhiG family RNA polymerase sigma factor [Candidatus Sericytochromatia bacterium]|nr:FliA/WhiG family RNA polymerase sigma factor [Candidatus Sericytochromatia bacterium]
MTTSTADLWQQYTSKPDLATRERLVLEYLPLVKYVVGRLAVTLPPTVDAEDLLGYGVMGLIMAIERFSPERGFKFETFAISRIRGAVIDELRSQDWLPRSVRQKAKDLEATIRTLENELGRTASDQELAGRLGVGVEDLPRSLSEITAPVLSLDELVSASDDGQKLSWLDTLPDDRLGPAAQLDHEAMLDVLGQAIDLLPERERLLVSLYYHEGLTLKEIGAVLGVTESRVCQLHGQAMGRLRTRINQLVTA